MRSRGVVVKFMSNMLIVEDAKTKEKIRCHLRGRFKLQGLKPIVGDIVEYVRVQDAGVVESVLKRKNELLKPRVANIDQVVCVYTIKKPEVSLLILDKLLVLIEEAKLNVLLILNKIDLLTEEDKEKKDHFIKTYSKIYPLLCTSTKTGEGLEKLKEYFKDRLSVFAGLSGVGKSSLLNSICPGINLRTQEISERTKRGKHTTTAAELIHLPFGGHVVDTPGFSLIDISHVDPDNLKFYFPEFVENGNCLFKDCTHISEPGCRIKQMVEEGKISTSRYESYVTMYKEVSK
ncbi:ribosome small subunit-dependent GTPase A [Pseudothermotoga sp.]|uniref:ribosome small subunit-dependent GTPase A n=1 Tax=Pseudothermotoga sp. TaxID=2033661 RepID=UPI000E86446D|nr:ribosome small subunit-dependent GTPase A [Pseudothermotoga sp.]HBJ82227.1 ribosome small subunit-dependent GTPase A [Pseudothermotoga sp.]